MKPINQLLRCPLKSMLGFFLISLACALLCSSIGQHYAAYIKELQIDKEYTTIALPTNKYKVVTEFDENGNEIGTTYSTNQPHDIRDYLHRLQDRYPEIVKSVDQHGFISGYCNSITPISYSNVALQVDGDIFTQIDNKPYTCAILAIVINEISNLNPYFLDNMAWGEINADDYGFVVNIEGTVVDVCSLAEGYDNPTGRSIHIELRLESKEAFSALELTTGDCYLVYGTNYTDLDERLRQNIAGGDQSIYDSISCENISILTEEDRTALNKSNHLYGIESEYVAEYKDVINGEEFRYLLNEIELSYMDSCSMTVCSNPSVAQGNLTQTEIPLFSSNAINFISQADYAQLYQQAGIISLDSTVSLFWNSCTDESWKNALATTEINNHSFPIISTPNLQSIAQFAMQDAYIASGRRFTQEEYDHGIPVCILSESLAVQNGLTVGDCITIQCYQSDLNLPGQNHLKTANPSAAYFSSINGFCGETTKYEIVGLYCQKNEWNVYDYAFTPNTIFVPENSLACSTEKSDSGIFCTYVLKNGMLELMDAELTDSGYEGLLSYYDQGYSDIVASLTDYFSVANMILIIGIISWIVFITAFLLLFPIQQNIEIRRMWTLGASQVLIIKYIVTYGLGLIVPGFTFGGIISVNLLREALEYISEYANINLEYPPIFLLVFLIVLAQIVIVNSLVYLIAKFTVRSFQRE